MERRVETTSAPTVESSAAPGLSRKTAHLLEALGAREFRLQELLPKYQTTRSKARQKVYRDEMRYIIDTHGRIERQLREYGIVAPVSSEYVAAKRILGTNV